MQGLPTPFAEAVLDLVAAIPPGRVMAYGDIARTVGGGGPRQVGSTMARFGGGVPWWRVVRSDGRPAAGLARQALTLLRGEGAPLVAAGDRVDMSRGRWWPDRGLSESSAAMQR